MNDCNNCQHLSMTEEEQDRRRDFQLKHLDHICEKYGKQVRHYFPRPKHPDHVLIEPLKECTKYD